MEMNPVNPVCETTPESNRRQRSEQSSPFPPLSPVQKFGSPKTGSGFPPGRNRGEFQSSISAMRFADCLGANIAEKARLRVRVPMKLSTGEFC